MAAPRGPDDQAGRRPVQSRRAARDPAGRHDPRLSRALASSQSRGRRAPAQPRPGRARLRSGRDRDRGPMAGGHDRRRRAAPALARGDRDGHPRLRAGGVPPRHPARLDRGRDARRRRRRVGHRHARDGERERPRRRRTTRVRDPGNAGEHPDLGSAPSAGKNAGARHGVANGSPPQGANPGSPARPRESRAGPPQTAAAGQPERDPENRRTAARRAPPAVHANRKARRPARAPRPRSSPPPRPGSSSRWPWKRASRARQGSARP